MRRKSLFGPVLLIAIGALLLLHNFRPEISLLALFAAYWPWILIAWGGFHLFEVAVTRLMGRSPTQPLGGGAVVLALLIIAAGSLAHSVEGRTFRFPDWPEEFTGLVSVSFTLPLESAREPVAEDAGTLVLRDLRGRVRVVGVDAEEISLSGRKRIRARSREAAGREADKESLQFVAEGRQIVLQSRSIRQRGKQRKVSFDVELSVPKRLVLRTENLDADIDVSGLGGAVRVEGARKTVSLRDIGGPIRVKARRGRRLRAEKIGGSVELDGSTRRVELMDIAGDVRIKGNLFATIRLERLQQTATVSTKDSELSLAALSGNVEMKTRSVSMEGVQGPLRFSTRRVRKIRLEDVSGDVEVTAERADVSLRGDISQLTNLAAKLKRGDLEIILPPESGFSVEADTNAGKIRHEYGTQIRAERKGRAASLKGSTGEGPHFRLHTGRGDISLKPSRPSRGQEQRVRWWKHRDALPIPAVALVSTLRPESIAAGSALVRLGSPPSSFEETTR